MKGFGSIALAAVLAFGGIGAAPAATYRVDDTGTVQNQAVVKMKWRRMAPGRVVDNTVDGEVRVALRLNLQPFLNQPVRLFMGLADSSGEPVYATWRTQGRLLAGQVRSGGRALVFEGVVGAPLLEETIDLKLSTDGSALTWTQNLQFYFEVDTQ